MTTSSSTDFDLTRNEIIGDALVHCGAIEAGEAGSAVDVQFAARQLNRMVKEWQADGIHLWKRKECHLFQQLSQARYQLGGASGEHFAFVEDSVRTALAAAMTAGAGTIDVDSVTGLAIGDAIGVVLDDKSIEWDTIAGIADPTVTLTGTIDNDDAASGNAVFAYTTKLERPLRVIAVQRTNTSDIDTPISMISHHEYQELPNKTNTGLTNEAYYQPELSAGYLYTWPEAETAADRLRLTATFDIEDYDASSNTSDLPQEWLNCLTWNLADQLVPSYGTPERTARRIERNALVSRSAALGFDREPEAVQFAPDFSWRG